MPLDLSLLGPTVIEPAPIPLPSIKERVKVRRILKKKLISLLVASRSPFHGGNGEQALQKFNKMMIKIYDRLDEDYKKELLEDGELTDPYPPKKCNPPPIVTTNKKTKKKVVTQNPFSSPSGYLISYTGIYRITKTERNERLQFIESHKELKEIFFLFWSLFQPYTTFYDNKKESVITPLKVDPIPSNSIDSSSSPAINNTKRKSTVTMLNIKTSSSSSNSNNSSTYVSSSSDNNIDYSNKRILTREGYSKFHSRVQVCLLSIRPNVTVTEIADDENDVTKKTIIDFDYENDLSYYDGMITRDNFFDMLYEIIG